MAVGTPLVASDAGALPEVVVNNQTGLLFGNGSAAELAAKLAELLGQPDLRERLACSAKIHAADSYAFSRYQRRIAELLGSD
jgi:glycosyltransferase involved in cell wall biosynthesis